VLRGLLIAVQRTILTIALHNSVINIKHC